MSYRRSSHRPMGAADVASPTRTRTSTEVRSPTSTSTDAYTSGNVTVTGGAGAGAHTTVHIHGPQQPRSAATRREHQGWLGRRLAPVVRATPDGYKAQDVSAPSNYVRATDHPDVSRSLVPRATWGTPAPVGNYFPVGVDGEPAIVSVGSFISLARALLNNQPATTKHAVAYASFEASAPTILTFGDVGSRDALYNGVVSTGAIAKQPVEWIAKFSRDADGDWISAANRRLTATTVRKTDWMNQIPWVVAGGVVIAAAVYLTRTMKKRAAGRGRTRSRSLARARRR